MKVHDTFILELVLSVLFPRQYVSMQTVQTANKVFVSHMLNA